MAALDYLLEAGLTVESVADRLRVSPAERITDDIRRYVVEHKGELLAELTAANDDQPAHSYILTAATASPEWIAARDNYIGHLMACRACYAPTGRYCAAGARLLVLYESTPMAYVCTGHVVRSQYLK